jgi:hypothetical protein
MSAAQHTPGPTLFDLKDQLETARILGDHAEIDRLKEAIRVIEEAEDAAWIDRFMSQTNAGRNAMLRTGEAT